MHSLSTAGRINDDRQNEELASEIRASPLTARDYSPWRPAEKRALWIICCRLCVMRQEKLSFAGPAAPKAHWQGTTTSNTRKPAQRITMPESFRLGFICRRTARSLANHTADSIGWRGRSEAIGTRASGNRFPKVYGR